MEIDKLMDGLALHAMALGFVYAEPEIVEGLAMVGAEAHAKAFFPKSDPVLIYGIAWNDRAPRTWHAEPRDAIAHEMRALSDLAGKGRGTIMYVGKARGMQEGRA